MHFFTHTHTHMYIYYINAGYLIGAHILHIKGRGTLHFTLFFYFTFIYTLLALRVTLHTHTQFFFTFIHTRSFQWYFTHIQSVLLHINTHSQGINTHTHREFYSHSYTLAAKVVL